jgi:hypothetical protein
MEEFAVRFDTTVQAVESETNLLIGSSEPFALGVLGDEPVSRVGTVAGYVFNRMADPAFSTCTSSAAVASAAVA